MSHLEELINELCPNGVEYKKLGKVCDFQNGYAFKSTKFASTGCPILRITNINNGLICTDNLVFFNKEDYKENLEQYKVRKGDIVIAMSGATTGKIGKSGVEYELYLNQRAGKFIPRKELDNGYLFHILLSQTNTFYKLALGGAQPNLSTASIKELQIPVPPLPVQEEIVRILDKYTTLEAKLEEKLEAELEARKQQYEYYRDKLLTFTPPPTGKSKQKVEFKTMGEIGTFIRGKRFVRTDIVEKGVPCIHYGDMYMYYGHKASKTITYLNEEKASKMRFAKKNDVVIVGAGENKIDIGVGLAWLGEDQVAVHDACYIYRSDLEPRYVSHFLRTADYHKNLLKWVSEGKICSVSAQSLSKTIIPIPPVEKQKQIADILDKFEKLTTDLTQGLPAEIEARRQQYEYYRDKLLTFKRKTA